MDDIIKAVDTYIEGLIEPWNAVGLAIGIVKDNRIVFKKGYGLKDHTQKDIVDTKTLFAIGSLTKAFTSTAIASLIRLGKIKSWNDKVVDYLPYYKASDEYAQNNMTIKDLLSMRSGYSKKDYDNMLFHGSHYTMDEIIEKSRYIPFDLAFRDRMKYNNLNYILLGKIIEECTNLSWHEFISKEIFDKINMPNSGSTYEFTKGNGNMASPHLHFNGKIHKIPIRNCDNVAPAGSIFSCVDDMINWMLFQMSDGVYNNHTIAEKEDMVKMHTPYTVVDKELNSSGAYDDVLVPAYGFGWFVYSLNGVSCIGHGGHIDGFSSYLQIVPEKKLGIVILNNSDNSSICLPIIRTITDAFFNKEPAYNYNNVFLEKHVLSQEEYFQEYNDLLNSLNKDKIEHTELQKYCGNYSNKIFGTQKIEIKNNMLCVERFDWKGVLKQLEGDTFVALWDNDLTHPPLKFEFIKKDGVYKSVIVEMLGEFTIGEYAHETI
jgi:CubicO group peptidase (beta-lactamase class C family)